MVRHVEPGYGSAEAALYRLFDFGDTDPVAEVRGALPSIEGFTWLEGLSGACREAAAKMSMAGRPVRAQELPRHDA